MSKILNLLLIMIVIFSCKEEKKNSQGEEFSKNINQVANEIIDASDQLTFFDEPRNPIKPKFELLPSGSVKPKGWILQMMKSDLEKGIVGNLDELYPGIKSDDLYNTARRGGLEDVPEMGDLVLTGEAWEKSIMWWNAETTGNWWDGFVRHAFLTDNQEARNQAKTIVENLLESQDEDGYLGIYKPNLRYQHDGANGELWAQTTAFRTMLAYYEFTQDKRVLDAVEKAVKLTIKEYGEEGKNPFYLKNAFGGVTHGLMFTDVCETLARITGNSIYSDYATHLYRAFSTYSINRSFNDMRYTYLVEKDSAYEGHAAHTYEHIRSMAHAYFNTGYPELKTAYTNMLHKLDACILPSGAGHGNEWIAKKEAHPEYTGAEFCTMLELRNSMGSLLQKTGNIAFADQAEKITYNAMLGARNEDGTAITYGKSDNCYILDGHHHEYNEKRVDPRYKYSPTHSEPAVCCSPNYTRNLPYFLDCMYMKSEKGIAALLFGPSELITKINDSKVVINQITNYPISDEITFEFELDSPQTFEFKIRKPQWSKAIVENQNLGTLVGDFYIIQKEWKSGDKLTIQFENELQWNTTNNNEYYAQRGPLVFALEIPHNEEIIKEYSEADYKDYYCFPNGEDFKNLTLQNKDSFKFQASVSVANMYKNYPTLEGELFNTKTKKTQKVQLVPMGKTILRRVSFPNS